MPALKPFDGYLVAPEHADEVVTPAYDAMLPAARRAFAEKYPGNYVNVMRTLDEHADDEVNKPTLDDILQHNKRQLNALFEKGAFTRIATPSYFLYQLSIDDHVQVGLIADIPINDYAVGRLRKHEHTQTEKENLLTHYNEIVGVTSNPVCVAYTATETILDAVADAMLEPPYLKIRVWDDVEQTVWQITNPETCKTLEREFNHIDITYLTDGHHRCASGLRFSENARSRGKHDADASHNYLLVAMFPAHQLRVFSYFRCVRDLNGLEPAELVGAIDRAGFDIHAMNSGTDTLLPTKARDVTMLIDNIAYRIKIPDHLIPQDDPAGRLDVSIIQDQILTPILGIGDARSDSRLSYMPGSEGISGLQQRCTDGWRVGFACFNTTVQEIMDVADAGKVMPPKSTWFDPKLRAGLFLRYC